MFIRFQDKSLIRASLANLTFHPGPGSTGTEIRSLPPPALLQKKVNYDANHKSSFLPLSSVDRFFSLQLTLVSREGMDVTLDGVYQWSTFSFSRVRKCYRRPIVQIVDKGFPQGCLPTRK